MDAGRGDDCVKKTTVIFSLGLNQNITLKKLLITTLLIVAFTSAISAGYLMYNGNFNKISFSNMLYSAGMIFMVIGGASSFGTNEGAYLIEYKYLSSLMSANERTRRRMDDGFIESGIGFTLKMVSIGVVLMFVSAAAYKFM